MVIFNIIKIVKSNKQDPILQFIQGCAHLMLGTEKDALSHFLKEKNHPP